MSQDASTLLARQATVSAFGALVDAMRGIAAARAHKTRRVIAGVESYAATVAAAMAQAQGLSQSPSVPRTHDAASRLILVFCSEQAFDGGLAERVIDVVRRQGKSRVILLGSHGLRAAHARGIDPEWSGPAIAHVDSAVSVAESLHAVLARALSGREAAQVDLVHARLSTLQHVVVACRRLLPLNPAPATIATDSQPIIHLGADRLLDELLFEHVAAQLLSALLHAHAAENISRLQAMTAAHENVIRMNETLARDVQQLRQQTITAEIVELAAGLGALAADESASSGT